jgi:NADH-quinone oxidoreductase subunit D
MVEITIPIGPQHPALKEPVNFMIRVDGESIVGADLLLAYSHRGVEKAIEFRTYLQNIYLVERICGICSHSHTTCYCQGVEELLGLEVPKRGLYIRTLIAELERIHSHLLWIGVAGHELGFDTLFMYAWRDRELVQDILETLTGNRVNYGINTIGGVRRDVTDKQINEALRAMDVVEERTKYYTMVATTESSFLKRASGVGILPKETAISLCAVGPTTRGSDVKQDVRKDDPYAAYEEVPFDMITSDLCDVLGRTVVRAKELIECVKICRYLLENMPEGDVRVAKVPRKVPPGEVYSRYEAPRGEVTHYIKSNGTDKPERDKVRAPTLANWPSVIEMLKGGVIADIPIVVAAIDPCLSCTARFTLVDVNEHTSTTMDWETLRQYGIKWYEREYGIKPELTLRRRK